MVKLERGFIIMQVSRIGPLVAAGGMLCASGAIAQETQAYTYDVHGRLTKVVRTQGTTTRTTNYAIDNANNRTSRAITSTTSSSAMAEPAVDEVGEGRPTDEAGLDGPAKWPAADDDLLPAVNGLATPQASSD